MDNQLVKLTQATRLLCEAKTIEEVREIIEMANVAQYYAKKAKLGEEAVRHATEIKIRAERKAGEFLHEKIEQGGDRKTEKSKSNMTTLKDIGITKDQSSKYQKIASIPRDKFEREIIKKDITTTGMVKIAREIENKERFNEIKNNPPKIPIGEFNIIYADPPWRYDFAETKNRDIENHYPTMELEEIKNMKLPITDNAVLLIWATAPKLLEAIEVLQSWGFNYKTCAVWDKETIGMGYWFRGQHELLLIGVKGNFSPPIPENRFSSVFREKKTKHSKKPIFYYEMIEKMFPNQKYLEVFARGERANWEFFGTNDF